MLKDTPPPKKFGLQAKTKFPKKEENKVHTPKKVSPPTKNVKRNEKKKTKKNPGYEDPIFMYTKSHNGSLLAFWGWKSRG